MTNPMGVCLVSGVEWFSCCELTNGVLTPFIVIRGWLVRRCTSNIALLQFGSGKGNGSDDVLVNKTYLAELQQRVLNSEIGLREKEEERDILFQRLQQYESRWSEYEHKMKSMEEVWQKQMDSLQSSLSTAKQSLYMDNNSDGPVNITNNESSDARRNSVGGSQTTAGLSLISRLAEEFEQRSQVFGDDARFLVEVKSGEAEANLNPEQELRRLKQMFEGWKKDYGARLREAKVILNKISSDQECGDEKVKKNYWWGRLNSSRIN